MIRNPIKIGVVTGSANGVEYLPVPVGHKGTISHLMFVCYQSGVIMDEDGMIDNITLECTHQNEGNFAILNRVTPGFFSYQQFLHLSQIEGITSGIIHYDPAAGLYKDEALRNVRTLGCADLADMTLRFDFGGSATSNLRVEVYADIDYNLIQNLGEHIRIDSLTDTVTTSAGVVEITELPRMDARFGYNALHIENLGTSTNGIAVDKLTMIINGQQYPYRDVPAAVINHLLKLQGRTPQTDFQTVEFGKEDLPNYFLPAGMNEFKVIPEFKKTGTHAGGSFRVWYELLKKAV